MSAENKFAKYRSRYRKVYGFVRTEPNLRTFTDTLTNTTKTVDVNQVLRDRDYFIVEGLTEQTFYFAEYEENLVSLNNESYKFVAFSSTFTNIPIITLDIYPEGSDNVNPYLIRSFINGFELGLSSHVSGSIIRYKAINLVSSSDYPAKVHRYPLLSGTIQLAYAGTRSFSNEESTTLRFYQFDSIPELNATSIDFLSGNQADLYVDVSSLSRNNSIINLSSYFSGSVNFIALAPS